MGTNCNSIYHASHTIQVYIITLLNKGIAIIYGSSIPYIVAMMQPQA